MINKKNVLGKAPFDLGEKDAIHVAIVSVRAGQCIQPGQRCKLNEHREAVPDKNGVGVADPFRDGNITKGKPFWLMLNQDAVPNVQHVWEHPSCDFTPPAREVVKNRSIESIAKDLGVTYDELMDACAYVVKTDNKASYPGTLDRDALDVALDRMERCELWGEWAGEAGHEFENFGSGCCPEYEYPHILFALPPELPTIAQVIKSERGE